jgi:hypothetical protein
MSMTRRIGFVWGARARVCGMKRSRRRSRNAGRSRRRSGWCSELELLLFDGGALFTDALLGFLCLPAADGGKERLEVGEEVGLGHVEVPVEETKELLLHEVDFGDAEAKVVVAADGGVTGPVLVLGRGVVEVLCREDERGEEDAVDGAAHALCNRRKTLCQAVEVDERSHESWYLDVRASDESADEKLD